MAAFKFRAESVMDVLELLRHPISDRALFMELHISRKEPFPDVEVELNMKNVNLVKLRNAMGKVADGHVMVQTVALKEKYTGKRNGKYS
jgi:hypothetical protein